MTKPKKPTPKKPSKKPQMLCRLVGVDPKGPLAHIFPKHVVFNFKLEEDTDDRDGLDVNGWAACDAKALKVKRVKIADVTEALTDGSILLHWIPKADVALAKERIEEEYGDSWRVVVVSVPVPKG